MAKEVKKNRSEPKGKATVICKRPAAVEARATSKRPAARTAKAVKRLAAEAPAQATPPAVAKAATTLSAAAGVKRPATAAPKRQQKRVEPPPPSTPRPPPPPLPPAVVLNLARRPDRWEEARQRLETIGGLFFERIEAVDGETGAAIPETDVSRSWSTERNWRYVTQVFEGGVDCGYMKRQLRLTAGERGCAASHIALWRRCAAAPLKEGNRNALLPEDGAMLVLEDDALPKKDFVRRLRLALQDLHNEAPDLLFLGYTQAAPWRRIVSAHVREAEYLWTTVGYVIWPSGAQKLLANLPVDQPVDNFMANLTAQGTLRCFAIEPLIVQQAKAWGVDADVAHSDDVAWLQNNSE